MDDPPTASLGSTAPPPMDIVTSTGNKTVIKIEPEAHDSNISEVSIPQSKSKEAISSEGMIAITPSAPSESCPSTENSKTPPNTNIKTESINVNDQKTLNNDNKIDQSTNAIDQKTLNNNDIKRLGKKRNRTELDYDNVKLHRENGLLSIEPYIYTHTSYAKRRWIGHKVLDIYTKEFLFKDRAYYEKAIADENIMVNGKGISVDHVITDGDLLSHKTLCSENPVLDMPIQIVCNNDDLLVVNKPSSIPIHACGVYRYLTLVSLLKMEGYDYPLLTLHRLDRLTSGLVLLAKTKKYAQYVTGLFVKHKVLKTYLARVSGDIRKCNTNRFGIIKTEDGIIIEGYMRCVNFQIGKHVLEEEDGTEKKYSNTLVKFDSYDEKSDESIVQCFPKTGRTHQIRVHLQHLGYPIANDPCYPKLPEDQLLSSKIDTPVEDRKDDAPTDYCKMIYLHAWRYQSDEWNFLSQRPSWSEKIENVE